MTLSSVLHTALSGLAAAEFAIDVTSNNLANSQTPGFKAATPVYVAQDVNTLAPGSATDAARGGANPRQIGLGVRVAAATVDHSQGNIAVSAQPFDVALQGDGFLVVAGAGGERFFTRDGQLRVNAAGELVTAGGLRVLGFAADDRLKLQEGELTPLSIPFHQGFEAGDGRLVWLTEFHIDADGRIRGSFSDGQLRDIGQIQLARFPNAHGLVRRGENLYSAGANSGLPYFGSPGRHGLATFVPSARELSNTDIGRSLIDLQLASLQYRLNLHTLSTSEQLLHELANWRRPN